jgi:PTH1 family peptidyl-tRNA hydrolase
MSIKLIVGLGNPGKDYQSHRHNVGFWFVDALARLQSVDFKKSSKLLCDIAQAKISKEIIRIAKPYTYMNRSGQSIQSIAKFYQINCSEILVAHDDLDLSPGVAKVKYSGGHGGHNGLRDTIKALGSNDFFRLRLGIGHPGDRSKVTDFVLHSPDSFDIEQIQNALVSSLNIVELMVSGRTEQAMKDLNTKQ